MCILKEEKNYPRIEIISNLAASIGIFKLFYLTVKSYCRGGVEDTRLEVKTKAKDTKKIRDQGQEQPFRGQNLSRPRTGMLEVKDQGHRRKRSPEKKKKVFKNIFQAIFNSLIHWRTQNF